MNAEVRNSNIRILVIDDNPSIHRDFRSVLCPDSQSERALDAAGAALFGDQPKTSNSAAFEIDSAFQGQDGLELVRSAMAADRPYDLAFVDVRMPPGWDGIETITRIWESCPDLQVVICTAYSDYSWVEMTRHLPSPENWVILKKPFDITEMLQLAHSLARKSSLARQARSWMEELDQRVHLRTLELQASNQELARQINERKSAQDALGVCSQNLERIFNNLNVAIFIHDAHGEVLAINDKMLDLYQVTRDQVQQFSFAGDYSDRCNTLDSLPSLWAKVMTGETCSMEWIARRPHDGSTFPAEVFLRRIAWDGKPAVMATVADLTEKKSLEKQVLRAQRLESVGTLAAGIAHDLNNILAPILMSAEVLRLETGAPDRELLATIQASAQRGAAIVKQVLTFARGVEGQRVTLQPRHLIRDMNSIAEKTFPKSITLRSNVARDLWTVNGDATQLHQVLLNLYVNARDAMPAGGALFISAENTRVSGAKTDLFAAAKPGPYVLIQVRDTGEGIPAAVLEKIFDPFFTTKEPGKGTGLGLSTVLGIVKGHGGFVQIASKVGQGTQFAVFLPAAERSAAQAKKAPGQELPQGNGELVLVVDDEEAVCIVARRTLEKYGYRVLTVQNGAEGIVACSQHRSQIQVVLTDMVMPIMDGASLIRVLGNYSPEVRIIAMTGLSGQEDKTFKPASSAHAFLSKPFTAEQLLTVVSQVLKTPREVEENIQSRFDPTNPVFSI